MGLWDGGTVGPWDIGTGGLCGEAHGLAQGLEDGGVHFHGALAFFEAVAHMLGEIVQNAVE